MDGRDGPPSPSASAAALRGLPVGRADVGGTRRTRAETDSAQLAGVHREFPRFARAKGCSGEGYHFEDRFQWAARGSQRHLERPEKQPARTDPRSCMLPFPPRARVACCWRWRSPWPAATVPSTPSSPSAGDGRSPGPAEVTSTLLHRRLEAVDTLRCAPRAGYLEKSTSGGTEVKKRSALRDRPTTFEADLEKAKADLARSRRRRRSRGAARPRRAPAWDGRLSTEDYQQLVAAREQARAAVKQARAAFGAPNCSSASRRSGRSVAASAARSSPRQPRRRRATLLTTIVSLDRSTFTLTCPSASSSTTSG